MKKIISILLVAFLGLGSFALVNADSYVNGSVNAYNGYNNNWNNWNNYGQGNSANCKTYYDGCNTCSRQYPGGPQVCTKLACFAHGTPYCKDYFNNNNGGWNGNGWGWNNGWNGWGWNPWNPWRNYNWNGWGWNNWNNNWNHNNNGHNNDHDNDHDWDHH